MGLGDGGATAEVGVEDAGRDDGGFGRVDGGVVGVVVVFGGDLGGNGGAGFQGSSVAGHSEAVAGVVFGNEGVIFGEGEDGFGVVFGDAGDAGEVASGGGVGEVRELGFALLNVGSDGVGFAVVGAELGEDALVFNVALVVFHFRIPEILVLFGINTVGTSGPIHIGELSAGV